MSVRKTAVTLCVVAVLVAGGSRTSVAQQTGAGPQAEPAYSLEGAWYGMVSIVGFPATPSLDTFASDAQRPGVEGTMLCTIPAMQMNGLSFTSAGHGNWVRIAKNTYAFTAMRSIVDPTGMPYGWAQFWGTITAVTSDEYSGRMNAQFYRLDGTPFSPVFTGTLASRRVGIRFQDQP